MITTEELLVEDEFYNEERVDKFLGDVLEGLSRSQLKSRFEEILVNGKKVKLSHKVFIGDRITLSYRDPDPIDIQGEALPLDILFEDENCLVLNKAQGIVVHPANGNYSGTLVHGLLYYLKTLKDSFGSEEFRPGIVHRLDKDTSGVIITAKNPKSLEYLSSQFRAKTTKKVYLAIIKGHLPKKRGEVTGYIARDPKNRKRFQLNQEEGKYSHTRWLVLREWKNHSLVRLEPSTGRTHQLRVHMQSMNTPIVGDPIYSRKDSLLPQAELCLHAFRLTIRLPEEDKPRSFRAKLSSNFQSTVRKLQEKE